MAIDTKELRIGSHVEYEDRRCIVVGIADIMSAPKGDVALKYDDEVILNADLSLINPILITPELLTELGFKYHEYDNGKLWELDFPDLYKAYLYLEFDEDTTSTYNFHMWNMKEYEINGRVQTLHELENWIYLMYGKELIND